MLINSYKKKKNNIYEITLSNNEVYSLYDDVILKYELLLKKEINNLELKKILDDNKLQEGYYIALKYINIKLRTEQEIRKKLIDFNSEVKNYVVDRLKKEGYINNELYIKSYINDEINFKLIGPNKIIFDLKKLGFIDDEINNYLETLDNNIWINKIDKFINKKINSNHNLSGMLLKQKIMTELTNRGFEKDTINLVIENYEFNDDDNIKEKEYNKLKNKLSRKYSGEELEYRIKIGLLKKGYK